MILSNTVFILGAGMSNCYGYPTGLQLREEIINKSTDKKFEEHFTWEKGIDPVDLKDFFNRFKYSRCYSIDQFLALQNKEVFFNISKFLITDILISYENPNELFPSNKIMPYDLIWNQMIYSDGKITVDLEMLAKNDISFITFNYDRTLEYFLFNVIKNTYFINGLKASEFLKNIPIIHVYDSLIDYSISLSAHFKSFDYQVREHSIREIESLSKNLDFMRANEIQKESKNAVDLLHQAHNVIILGFGFDDFNINKVNLILQNKIVFASCKGLSKSRQANIKNKIANQSSIHFEDEISDVLGTAFLNIS
ncbi:MAG TPA: hypothetical protein VI757_14010 [Bacteroidia bacterium]|nr:hypothetical protein [Bacteroidia bacterium]